jgi:hypothetical protein
MGRKARRARPTRGHKLFVDRIMLLCETVRDGGRDRKVETAGRMDLCHAQLFDIDGEKAESGNPPSPKLRRTGARKRKLGRKGGRLRALGAGRKKAKVPPSLAPWRDQPDLFCENAIPCSAEALAAPGEGTRPTGRRFFHPSLCCGATSRSRRKSKLIQDQLR